MKYAKDTLKYMLILSFILLVLKSLYKPIYNLCGKRHWLAFMLICLSLALLKPTLDMCLTKEQKQHIKEQKDAKKVFIPPTVMDEDSDNPWGKSSFE